MRCHRVKINYQYTSPSMCIYNNNQTTLGLSADNSRKEQVSFLGRLKDPLIFRDAMLMLRQIVISGKEPEKKERTEFFTWLEQEIDRRVHKQQEFAVKIQQELFQKIYEEDQKRKEIAKDAYSLLEQRKEIEEALNKISMWKDYNRIEKDFWTFIRNRDTDLWIVLDPVITVHPDQVSFEAFSIDESTYGCLSIPIDEFELLKKPELGTTNIDFSAKLAEEMERFRTYTDVTLSVNPDGFTVDSGVMPEHIEKKIDLPETWIKGFSQVSSAACLNGTSIDLSPADFYDICSFLRRHKAKKSPRYMKWILEPEQRVKIVFEPFHAEITLNAIYHGEKKREEKIWGRRRWLVMERLIPIAKSFQVRLLGFGMPQFLIADLGVMKMTVGFSSWSANDWVKGTAFHILAGFIGEGNYSKVYELLRQQRCMSIKAIQDSLEEKADVTKAGIGMLLRKGEGYYDAVTDQIRFRQLCSEPIPKELYEVTDIENKVKQLLNVNMAPFQVKKNIHGMYSFTYSYDGKDYYGRPKKEHTVITIDQDGQIHAVSCTCRTFQSGDRNISAPCEHILALYLMSIKFVGLPFKEEKNYKINDIMEMLL